MASTEAIVRQKLVDSIEAIGETELGFDEGQSNIKNYLPEFHIGENLSSYFVAKVSGKAVHRVWAVQVLASDLFYTTTSDRFMRQYQIKIKCFYDLGLNGEGVNLAIDHARKIREVVKNLTTTLDATVDRVTSVSIFTPSIVSGFSGSLATDRLVTGEININAEKTSPTF